MIYAGIDAGSRAIKLVILDGDDRSVVWSGLIAQGVDSLGLSEGLLDRGLSECGLSRNSISGIMATGYARNMITFADDTRTEITCHALGVRKLVPEVRTIIEIGGQDSKLIRLDDKGVVYDFSMNDRCAAGTGRFLEIVAERFGIKTVELGDIAAKSTSPASISSTCVVFAETEIIGLLSSGAKPADIVAGVQEAIATRVASMAGRRLSIPIAFTGGVALIGGMKGALESALDVPVLAVCDPQMTGALGAAMLAAGVGK